ncbi:MAG: hypothetical protein M1814_000049 [Vezdaea aestivalis]|nr:MAG: hypothetical protein M1814_000049 [Vezdaea aestivalis]
MAAAPKTVCAHYMVGITSSYSLGDWRDDVSKAKAAGIDAFALNMGPSDSWNTAQLQNAITAAEANDFKLFVSFDFAAGAWSADTMLPIIRKLQASSAQFRVDGKPMVSTFEGPGYASTIQAVRSQISMFFLPDWTSLGPDQFSTRNSQVDGAFNWNAWPLGATNKNTDEDKAWQRAIGSKPYMMGVSPWFYTNLPQYNKNWVWRGDDLWHDRWMQAIALQPAFVQIITWNDYGESHYIGPIRPSGIVSGAQKYINDMPHERFLDSLPYYIAAYKNGGQFPAVGTEAITFWYRLSPAAACSTDGTSGNAPWQPQTDVRNVVQDKIFITVLLKSAAQVTVQIGTNAKTTQTFNTGGLQHFSIPFNGQTGNQVVIAIVRGGTTAVTALGKGISTTCLNGKSNFNVWTGGS